MFLYKFYDDNELLYLGKTVDLSDRMSGHFKRKKSPTSVFRDEIKRVEVCQFENEADLNIMEVYLISTLKPKYNGSCSTNVLPTYSLPEPIFYELTDWG